jgi:hypothetical protein
MFDSVQMFSNDTLDAHARAIGMPEPRHTAIIMTEYEVWPSLLVYFIASDHDYTQTPENMLAVRLFGATWVDT